MTPPTGAPFLLKVIAVGKPPSKAGQERRLADLQRQVDELHFDHFVLWVDVNRGWGPCAEVRSVAQGPSRLGGWARPGGDGGRWAS